MQSVRGVHRATDTPHDMEVSVGQATGPKTDGTPGDVLRSEGSEVAAVEAGWVSSEKEELAGTERPAAMPARHRASSRVVGKSERREPATDKNLGSEPADAVSRNSEDRLQDEHGAREICSASSEVSDGTDEPGKHEVIDPRRRPFDPVESDRNTGGRVPDEERRALAKRRGDEQCDGDQQAGQRGSLTPCARTTIFCARFWTTP